GYLYYGNTITWKQLSDYTQKFASFLQSKGIGKGDRIALYMQNCPQYLIGHYAIQMLGAIVVPLNPMYKPSELIYFISEAEIKAIISSQELYQHIESIKSETLSLEFIVTTNYIDLLPEQLTLPLPE
ncbi:AMP-dependent synthetase, partial [[Kluyvera] intestini]